MTMPESLNWEAVETSTAPSMAALVPADGCAFVVMVAAVFLTPRPHIFETKFL